MLSPVSLNKSSNLGVVLWTPDTDIEQINGLQGHKTTIYEFSYIPNKNHLQKKNMTCVPCFQMLEWIESGE